MSGVKVRNTKASEIIAEWLGTDIDSVSEMVYQPTLFRTVRVYSWDDNPWSYFCCPKPGQKPPALHGPTKWEIAGYSWRKDEKDRPVYGVKHENLK